jgi:molybdopterin synthase catalytic subunit
VTVSVQEADFDVGAEIAALTAGGVDAGAVASFVGLVRGGTGNGPPRSQTQLAAPHGEAHALLERSGEGIHAMTLEHYPAMTAKALNDIVAEAHRRWELLGVRVIHRVGRLLPGERIVLVAVSSTHRQAAFAACEFIMDYLKTRAPFWKCEDTAAGSHWVDARESDDEALRRWSDD